MVSVSDFQHRKAYSEQTRIQNPIEHLQWSFFCETAFSRSQLSQKSSIFDIQFGAKYISAEPNAFCKEQLTGEICQLAILARRVILDVLQDSKYASDIIQDIQTNLQGIPNCLFSLKERREQRKKLASQTQLNIQDCFQYVTGCSSNL